jgi:hypothetical protein
MKNQTVTGIGCFAKPERLGRIFNKLVQTYTLGPIKGNQLFDGHLPKESEGADLLLALMTDLTGDSSSAGYETPSFKGSKKIAGFYMSFKDHKLNLSIFARGNSSRSEIFTTSLDELTKLRQKRLN